MNIKVEEVYDILSYIDLHKESNKYYRIYLKSLIKNRSGSRRSW